MTASGRAGHTTLLALVLALACAVFAVRAVVVEVKAAPRLVGLLGAEAPQARALVKRLARGLLALQRSDGGFDLGEGGGYNYQSERVAASALATAALAHVHRLAPTLEVPGVAPAVARGLGFLRKQQQKTGAIGFTEPDDTWSQVDATSAGLLAFVLAGREEDAEAARGCARALKRFSRAGLRNGWTRALATMTIDRAVQLDRHRDLWKDWRVLVDVRQLKQRPAEGRVQTSDWNVAEALARAVLGLRKGVDPFPAQVVLACLDEEEMPSWTGPSSDCQAWWMQAWLVARSGSPDAGAWFRKLLEVLADEGVEDDDTIHGGWYANTVSQTCGAIFALTEGLSSQVSAP
jgi:hypothetical protein